MLTGTAIRNQLILPLQQSIYDYWSSLCRDGKLPSREDIEPHRLVRHLPMLTMMDRHSDTHGMRFQCRLVGTGHWDLFEDEIQGRYIDELPLGDRRDYWHRVLTSVVEKRRPTAGVTRPGTPFGGHKAQFWIRLPLSSNGHDVDTILGFDQMVKMSDVKRVTSIPTSVPMHATA